MHSGTVTLSMRVRRRFYKANVAVILCKRTQDCCATLHQQQSNRNVGNCCAKRLTDFKRYATSSSKCQHCCGSMQTDATCWARQCFVLLANNVAFLCKNSIYLTKLFKFHDNNQFLITKILPCSSNCTTWTQSWIFKKFDFQTIVTNTFFFQNNRTFGNYMKKCN